jgi:nickel-dependent lactate racemase
MPVLATDPTSESYSALGSPTAVLTDADVEAALVEALDRIGLRYRVLAVPPDFTRFHSRAGLLTQIVYRYYQDALADVLPALGTHHPLDIEQRERMFRRVPAGRFRAHHWREDVVTVGTIPGEEVEAITGGIYDRPWHAQLNRLIWEGGHDLILSLGQIVPHEVTGMANHAKNLFVGCGGPEGINESHYIGAVYGMERIMGRADTPPRQLLNRALERFCRDLPLVFALTVVGPARDGENADEHGLVTRGLFIGGGMDCFYQASELSQKVNITLLDQPIQKAVVYLNPGEYRSTWLGNKAIYRTRMALADGGELVILAPGVERFGEDGTIDGLIRKYGYLPSEEIQRQVKKNEDLQANLSAAAHLIHGSSEGRFQVTYCPGHLSKEEIEGVGYRYDDLGSMQARFNPKTLRDGWNTVHGEEIYFISNPAVGLWSSKDKFREN